MSRNKHIFTLLVFTIFLLGSISVYGQQKPHTKKPVASPSTKNAKKEEGMTNFQFGGGIMGSVLYLSRNIKEDNDALGYTINANYGGHKLVRFSVQYTKYLPINIEPTWYDIKANTFEANVEVLARFKNNRTFLYPYAGISYNTFKGYFTGSDDFLNLRERYQANSYVSSYWLGLNIGTGMEHAIGRFVVLFVDYRMRIGKTEQRAGFNIMDVCYSGGIRFKLWVPTLNKLYRGVGDKYHWF